MRYLNEQYMETAQNGNIRYIEIACTSAETKPTTGVAMGSIATEVDTGDIYMFNETSGTWVKQFGLQ